MDAETIIVVKKLSGGPVGNFNFRLVIPNAIIETGKVVEWIHDNWRKQFFPGALICQCGLLNPHFLK